MSTKSTDQNCPDCSRPLHAVGDYPTNELWCVHCGNRYFVPIASSEGEYQDTLQGFRILLLDDHGERRDYLSRHFMRLGYQVTPVCHPRQALEAASFRRFDVAVMPFRLSEFRCLDLICKLQRLLAGVKFVILSDSEGPLGSHLDTSEVICARVDPNNFGQLEQIVEQLIDDAVFAQPRSSTREAALAGSN